MGLRKWVQHISGQGDKFKVHDESCDVWVVSRANSQYVYRVPKSEYRECNPPEPEWEDVTAECRFQEGWDSLVHYQKVSGDTLLFESKCEPPYRLRKVIGEQLLAHQSAFIVERKKP